MQTQNEIRRLVQDSGIRLRKSLGHNFLIDRNLMNKLLETAALAGSETVLEVGAATGSLTEELLDRSARVVAVEIHGGLLAILQDRLGASENLTLIYGDVMAGKHAISPEVLAAVGPRAHMVANLPYSIGTPLVAECLLQSCRAAKTGAGGEAAGGAQAASFDRLTFTIQQEVADRLAAEPGGSSYGPVSVILSLLGRLTAGWAVPASAFWPRPKINSRIVRIDFDPAKAAALADAAMLQRFLAAAFRHRRKQIGSLLRLNETPWPAPVLADAIAAAGIDLEKRPQAIVPEQYLTCANVLAGGT